jgi:hypothetical protein
MIFFVFISSLVLSFTGLIPMWFCVLFMVPILFAVLQYLFCGFERIKGTRGKVLLTFTDSSGKPFPFVTAYAAAKSNGKDLSNWSFPEGYVQSDVESYISGLGFAKTQKSVNKLHNWIDDQKENQGIFDAPVVVTPKVKDIHNYWGS